MILVQDQRIWTEQPQYPVGVDKDHPLFPELVRAIVVPENYDACTDTVGTLNNVAAILGTPYGVSPIYNTTTAKTGLEFNNTTLSHSTEYTIAALAAPSAEARRSEFYFEGDVSGSPYSQFALSANFWPNNNVASAGRFALVGYGSPGWVTQSCSGTTKIDGNFHWFVGCRDNIDAKVYLDGTEVSESGGLVTAGDVNIDGKTSGIGGEWPSAGAGANFPIIAVFVWRRKLTAAEIKAYFSDFTSAFSLFAPEDDYSLMPSAGGGAAALAGNAAAVAAAAGAPTTAIPFNGGAVSIATMTGLATTAIDFVGVATGSANSAGDLFTQIKFDAAALAQALVQAGIDTGISFLGNATAQAGGGGDVTIQIAMLAAAISNALAQGALSGGTSGFASDAGARAQVTGELTTATPLIGDPKAYAGASGNITNIIQVVAASGAISNVTGDLTASITFTAQALAQALSQAFLTIQIRFAGTALAQAQANGTLAGTAPKPSPNPRYMVEIEPRLYEAEIAPRLYEVAA
ncbi:MAG: LamG-like jellyroll fold domain-containing protein [Burkholderiales bacterium]|nr:LamG-like jellyroll fold domain-containing protein [Burkholderiales bacterium]